MAKKKPTYEETMKKLDPHGLLEPYPDAAVIASMDPKPTRARKKYSCIWCGDGLFDTRKDLDSIISKLEREIKYLKALRSLGVTVRDEVRSGLVWLETDSLKVAKKAGFETT